MAGQFGWTTRERDGLVWTAHIWPLDLFRRHFNGFGESDTEDWKAAVYKWGGPKPSRIERVDISYDAAAGAVLVLWRERSEGTAVHQHSEQ
ncbi:MAG TPA: hypothetical protein VF944_10860 [Candidatus Bathyarchaeia archaeon]